MRRLTSQLRRHATAARLKLRALQAQLLVAVSGQGLVEYGLILVLIMVVCVGILTIVGGTVSEVWYDRIIQALP